MYLVYSVIILLINEASSCDLEEALSFELKDPSALSSLDLNLTQRGIPHDSVLNFKELTAKYNRSADEYFVITEDGYNLTLYNIPGDKKRPVLLAHGIFDSSDGWMLRGRTSLPYILAENGYDVWLLNQRGNRYARRHVNLDPDKPKFWDFSVHELGTYDLSVCIDFVLKATGEAQVSLVGFSEGTTMGYVLAATRPEYNKKIKCFICLAPIAFLHNTVGQMKLWILLGGFLDKILPIDEMVGFHTAMKGMIKFLCTQLIMGYEICYGGVMSNLIGSNLAGIEPNFFQTAIIQHFPAGTSKKNLVHFSQIGMRKRFSHYDYGSAKNMIQYGSVEPPDYDLEKVKMPVYLVSCKNDRVSMIEDVRLLATKLPNVLEWKVVPNERCNHLDHLWAVDAHETEYPIVLEILAKCFKKE